jgi:hypothetical protein
LPSGADARRRTPGLDRRDDVVAIKGSEWDTNVGVTGPPRYGADVSAGG